MTSAERPVPEPVIAAIDRWIEVHDEHAAGIVEGLYLVGSVALGDWHAGRSDIDIVAVTAEPADEETAGYLQTANAIVRAELPDLAIDGPYVAWGDLSSPAATGLHRPWSLDGVWHYDGDCFEINPVVWRTLRRVAIRVRGPQLGNGDGAVFDDDEELRAFIAGNLRSYWTDVHQELVGAIGEMSAESTLPASVIEWCVLGPARMYVTLLTGEIVSKGAAARRLIPELGDEHAIGMQVALDCRNGIVEQVGRSDAVLATATLGAVLAKAIRVTR